MRSILDGPMARLGLALGVLSGRQRPLLEQKLTSVALLCDQQRERGGTFEPLTRGRRSSSSRLLHLSTLHNHSAGLWN